MIKSEGHDTFNREKKRKRHKSSTEQKEILPGEGEWDGENGEKRRKERKMHGRDNNGEAARLRGFAQWQSARYCQSGVNCQPRTVPRGGRAWRHGARDTNDATPRETRDAEREPEETARPFCVPSLPEKLNL